MLRKIKPFHDFDQLTPEQLDRIHAAIAETSYEKTRVLLRDQFKILITYGRLRRYYIRFLETQKIKKQVGVDLTVNDYIKVQNGDALPFGAVTHHLIQKAACQQAAAGEEHTITELLGLQRIANADFQQKLAREKLALEQRRLALREQELALKHQAKPAPSTTSTRSTPSTSEPQEPDQKPFRMWTEEEVRTNQPKIEAAFQAHPVLRHIGLPPVDLPPTLPPDPSIPSDELGAHPSANTPGTAGILPAQAAGFHPSTPFVGGPSFPSLPSVKAPAAPTELDQLLAAARAHPDASIDPRFLRHVSAASHPRHLSRDLSLPLAHRLTFYAYARHIEENAGKNSGLVGRFAAQNFRSHLQWCPCGRDLPCPDHGSRGPHFFESFQFLHDFCFAHRLPIPEIGDLACQLRKIEEQESSSQQVPESAPIPSNSEGTSNPPVERGSRRASPQPPQPPMPSMPSIPVAPPPPPSPQSIEHSLTQAGLIPHSASPGSRISVASGNCERGTIQ